MTEVTELIEQKKQKNEQNSLTRGRVLFRDQSASQVEVNKYCASSSIGKAKIFADQGTEKWGGLISSTVFFAGRGALLPIQEEFEASAYGAESVVVW